MGVRRLHRGHLTSGPSQSSMPGQERCSTENVSPTGGPSSAAQRTFRWEGADGRTVSLPFVGVPKRPGEGSANEGAALTPARKGGASAPRKVNRVRQRVWEEARAVAMALEHLWLSDKWRPIEPPGWLVASARW